MENDVAESNVMKADNGKELKFSDCVKELQSGIKIYTWQLEPQVEKIRGILFICHGYGEHSRRYEKFAKLLCSELDILIVSHDHVGHGRSEGERVMIETFDTFVDDVFSHLDEIKKLYPNIPVYAFGHSMGGTITTLAACKKPEYFKAVVLSSPAIIIDPDVKPGAVKEFIGRAMNRFFPRIEIIPPLDPNVVSSNPSQVEAYRTDPLIWHSGGKLRFAIAFGEAMDKVTELSTVIEWPFLVLHGEADKLTYVGGSRLLEKNAKSQDKEIKTYKGLKHEMLNEVEEEADKVMSDILEWFRKRIAS